MRNLFYHINKREDRDRELVVFKGVWWPVSAPPAIPKRRTPSAGASRNVGARLVLFAIIDGLSYLPLSRACFRLPKLRTRKAVLALELLALTQLLVFLVFVVVPVVVLIGSHNETSPIPMAVSYIGGVLPRSVPNKGTHHGAKQPCGERGFGQAIACHGSSVHAWPRAEDVPMQFRLVVVHRPIPWQIPENTPDIEPPRASVAVI